MDFYNFPYIGNKNPIWKTPSFFRGVAQPLANQPWANLEVISLCRTWGWCPKPYKRFCTERAAKTWVPKLQICHGTHRKNLAGIIKMPLLGLVIGFSSVSSLLRVTGWCHRISHVFFHFPQLHGLRLPARRIDDRGDLWRRVNLHKTQNEGGALTMDRCWWYLVVPRCPKMSQDVSSNRFNTGIWGGLSDLVCKVWSWFFGTCGWLRLNLEWTCMDMWFSPATIRGILQHFFFSREVSWLFILRVAATFLLGRVRNASWISLNNLAIGRLIWPSMRRSLRDETFEKDGRHIRCISWHFEWLRMMQFLMQLMQILIWLVVSNMFYFP